MPTSTPTPYPPAWPPTPPADLGDWVWSAISNLWKWFGDQQGPVVALAAVITAVVAFLALRSTALDSRERSRPIVLAFFRKSAHNESAFDLVVHNFGPSAAFDVDIEFDPPFGPDQRQDHMADALAQRYEKRIPLMPPGSEITNVWWALDFSAPNHSGKNRYPMPDEATMTITYKRRWPCRFKEKIKLDTNWMKGDTSTVSSASRPGLAKQNTEALKSIAAESRAVRLHLQDIADSLETEPSSDAEEQDTVEATLATIVARSGGDIGALAKRLGVTEQKAKEIVALIEAHPATGETDVVSNGQISPGPAAYF